jgi:excinuclease UvrABC helicase subunit UvrB
MVEKAQRGEISEKELIKFIKNLGRSMKGAARSFTFDRASSFRDALIDIKNSGETSSYVLSLIDKFINPKKIGKKSTLV